MEKFLNGVGVLTMVTVLCILCAALTGYILNIIKLFGLFHEGFTVELLIRLVGVFTGIVGCIAGYF